MCTEQKLPPTVLLLLRLLLLQRPFLFVFLSAGPLVVDSSSIQSRAGGQFNTRTSLFTSIRLLKGNKVPEYH